MSGKILVAGSGNVTGHGVIEALHQVRIPVAGYDCVEVDGNPAQMFCENFQVPRASDHQAYKEAIIEVICRTNPSVIIPTNDHDLRALLHMEHILKHHGIRLNGSGPHTASFLDKSATSRLFNDHGIPTPAVLNGPEVPYVVRKRFVGAGKKLTRVVRNPDEATWLLGDREMIYTRVVDGQEYTIDIVCTQESRVLSIVPRLRRRVTDGIVTFGEVVKDDLVIQESKALAEKLQLRGINCVQCIRNDKGCFFFEVNPRPGSGMSLSTHAGVNMPQLWVQSLSGDVRVVEPSWGLKMIRYQTGYYFR